MATIRKRGSRYNVQIRKEGYPSITKTFASISVAKKWAEVRQTWNGVSMWKSLIRLRWESYSIVYIVEMLSITFSS